MESKRSKRLKERLSNDLDRICCAYHESGHAIIALINHFKLSDIGLDYESTYGGYCNFDVVECDEFKGHKIREYLIVQEIGVNFAGLAAEKINYFNIFGANQLPKVLKYGSGIDLKVISTLISKHELAAAGRARQNFKKQIFKHVTNQLQKHWSDVTLLAHRLYKRKRLSYTDIKKLLCSKSIYKEFWKNQFKEINFIFRNSSRLNERKLRYIIAKSS